MPTKQEPRERTSTDESLRSERRKTDAELARRSGALRDTAVDVVTEARDKADCVLSEARDLEDRKNGYSAQLGQERAREDAALRAARNGADAVARDDVEQRRVALARLLAFEREDFMAMASHSSREDPGVVELDHERILQVLTNLVGNALKFTPRGGTITIELRRRADAICFSVADTGSGIPTELLEKVFERYFQSHEDDRRGLGLGLFISRSIIEAHDGTIWATSTPGQGCTIFFSVPAPPMS